MKRKLIELALLVGGLLVALFIATHMDGIMHELLVEIHSDITNTTMEQWKMRFSGEERAATLRGYAWNLGFIAMWFIFQWLMLARWRHVVIKVFPLALSVFFWIMAEVLNVRLGSGDFTAYALCYATLHWIVGAWLSCFLYCIRHRKDTFL